jgi:hypothetical protein
MRFNDDEIGGKEVGPVNIDLGAHPRVAFQILGQARLWLGMLKQQMSFNHISALENRHNFGVPEYQSSVGELIAEGTLPGELLNAVSGSTKAIVRGTGTVSVSSIKGYGTMADTDFISIVSRLDVSIDASRRKPRVVGFSIHFKDTAYWAANVEYWVSEPMGSSLTPMLLTAYHRNPYAGWNFEIPRDLVTMDSTQWFQVGSIIINGVDYYGDWSRLSSVVSDVNVSDGSLTDYKYINTSAGAMYAIATDAFDHVDAKYTYEIGYVGKVSCIKYADVLETPVLYARAFPDDAYKTVTPGSALSVTKPKEFIDGWYCVGMSTSVQGSSAATVVMGGLTFIYHMSDGTEQVLEVDVDLYSGNWSITTNTNDSGSLNPGKYFLMFNPNEGLATLYQSDPAQNPFWNSGQPFRRDHNFYLASALSSSAVAVKGIDAHHLEPGEVLEGRG